MSQTTDTSDTSTDTETVIKGVIEFAEIQAEDLGYYTTRRVDNHGLRVNDERGVFVLELDDDESWSIVEHPAVKNEILFETEDPEEAVDTFVRTIVNA